MYFSILFIWSFDSTTPCGVSSIGNSCGYNNNNHYYLYLYPVTILSEKLYNLFPVHFMILSSIYTAIHSAISGPQTCSESGKKNIKNISMLPVELWVNVPPCICCFILQMQPSTRKQGIRSSSLQALCRRPSQKSHGCTRLTWPWSVSMASLMHTAILKVRSTTTHSLPLQGLCLELVMC